MSIALRLNWRITGEPVMNATREPETACVGEQRRSTHRRRNDHERVGLRLAVAHGVQSVCTSLLVSAGCCVVVVAASTVFDVVEMVLDAIAAVIFGVLGAIAAVFAAIFGLFGS